MPHSYSLALPELTFGARECRLGGRPPLVRKVQEWLTLHGIGVRVDGHFGPATQRAVTAFQEQTSRPPTGIVDLGTYEALTAPMRRVLAHIPGKSSVSDLVLAYARQHLMEHPREVGGVNRGPWVRLYMEGSQEAKMPWSAGFACFVMRQAADALKIDPPFNPTVSCDELAARAQRAGLFVSGQDLPAVREKITPGSLFLCRKSSSRWTHVGVVTSMHDDVIETVEGNTYDAGARDCYEVCRRIRTISDKDFVCFR